MRTLATAPRRGGLATRLLTGQVLVLLAGAVTAGVVAALIGPVVFHDHLMRAGLSHGPTQLYHIETAYRDASLVSLGVGLAVALIAATGVTWLFMRRLRRPLDRVAAGARDVARGRYTTRIPEMRSGTELDELAAAFNVMAARLEDIENTRRRMLADLAHELRTPIATLVAYHDGLHDGVASLGGESRTVLAAQTGRLTRLADDIDEVVTAEEGRLTMHPGTVPVADLLWGVHTEMRDRYARKGVNLVIAADRAAGLYVTVDRRRMAQALSNLLTNALRHTPPGGTVTISAHRSAGRAVIAVADTGDGIPAGQLPRIFERFYRGDGARDRDQSGSGIGLTITKAIIDAHGGRITAASDGVGRGAAFEITLPLAARGASSMTAGTVPGTRPGAAPGTRDGR